MAQELTITEYFIEMLKAQSQYKKERWSLTRDYMERVHKESQNYVVKLRKIAAQTNRTATSLIDVYSRRQIIYLINQDLQSFLLEEGVKVIDALKENKNNTSRLDSLWLLTMDTELSIVKSDIRPLAPRGEVNFDLIKSFCQETTDTMSDPLASKLLAEADDEEEEAYKTAQRRLFEDESDSWRRWSNNCEKDSDFVSD